MKIRLVQDSGYVEHLPIMNRYDEIIDTLCTRVEGFLLVCCVHDMYEADRFEVTSMDAPALKSCRVAVCALS